MILMTNGLRAFKAIVESGTVHSAAKNLGLTQTAMTQRLKGLEKELGLTLFLRSRRGMSLTGDGAALLKYCRSIEDLEGGFLSRVSGKTRGDVELTVVGPTSAISSRVVDDCKEIYAKYPFLRLHLRSDDHSNRVDLVRRGDVDFAIVSPKQVPREMDSKVLKDDRYLLVASSKWKGRSFQDILSHERIIDFYESDDTTVKYLEKFGHTPLNKERIYVNENQALISLFSQGVGYGTLTEYVARPYIESGKLLALNRSQTMSSPLALVWYPRTQKPDYFVSLVQSIK